MKFGPLTIEENLATSRSNVNEGKLPLLVIEDENSVQLFLSAALKKRGYTTLSASSGMQALQLLREKDFCAVIADIRIPGQIKIADLQAWISAHRPQLLPRMLFMTGDLSGEEAMRAIAITSAPCLEKPFRLEELMTALNQVLES